MDTNFRGFSLAKITTEFKLAVVRRYEYGNIGCKSLAKEYGLSDGQLRRWLNLYQVHGKAGLEKKSASYSAEQKLAMLQHMWDNKLSKGQAATAFNIRRHATVAEWERAYRQGGIEALEPRPIRRPEMQPEKNKPDGTETVDNRSREELLDELLHLRAEVAYLKKLDALVRSQAQAKALSKAPRKKRK